MKTLLLFSTRDGQTREIATRIADQLQQYAETVVLVNLHEAGELDWSGYDKVVIGASIRYGHFHPALRTFVDRYAAQLNALPGAFFSVNLVARKPEKRTPETNAYTRKFLASSAWKPDYSAVFAGALRYPRYRWFDRFMIRLIMKMTGGETDVSKEIVYTDWQQVAEFARSLAHLSGKKVENQA
ncbi:menaquinone-dependent protoporphyrinogen IX dehydrogenase [Entomohabitans teleogrylli]|uniref:menaquinone-dependent protoporphyrinogen IX dehydrogenase n=1 Tax=Entomohabitans teleogrylli TaxID=1384589 RepID=UPI00073D405D|nr:menaquinone-dependent protoporphyrinogen IX dehydrogenase [Entomohabitans teleogrylli]